MRHRSVYGVLVLLALAPFNFAQKRPVLQYTTDELEAVQAVQKNLPKNVPHILDVGDPVQYRYVKALYRIHGASPERYPRLHKQLEDAYAKRRGGRTSPPRPAPGWDRDIDPAASSHGMTSQGGGSSINPMNIIAFMANTGSNVTTSMLSSVPGGTYSTAMSVNYRMSTSTQPFANSQTYTQYNAGTQYQQSYNAAPAASGTVVATALITTTQTQGGIPVYTTLVQEDSTPNATAQCVTAPYYAQYTAPPTSCPAVGSNCVNAGSITTNIVSCYGRSASDCNYGWGGTGYPANLLMQVSGTMTFPSPIDPSLTGTYSLNMQVVNNGGCTIGYESSTLPSAYFSVDPNNSNQLNYCFAGASLPSNPCMQQATVAMYLILQVAVELDVTTGGNIGTAIVSSNTTQSPGQPWYALIPTIQVLQGCVAPGTRVTLADGTQKAIETINGDGSQWALIDTKGSRLPIMGVSTGTETRPMVEIVSREGHTVLVSQMHPVATQNGMTPAVHVNAGDTLFTPKGKTRVRSVRYVPYDGPVYNIAYTPVVKQEPKAFFANDILVGDLSAQQQMSVGKKPAKPLTKAQMLKILPKEWHRDYLSSLTEPKQ